MTSAFQESVKREKNAKKTWAVTFDRNLRKASDRGSAKLHREQTVFSTKFPLTATMMIGRTVIGETAARLTDPKKWAMKHINASQYKLDYDNGWMKEAGTKHKRAVQYTPPDAAQPARLPKYLKPAPTGNPYIDSYPRKTGPAAFAEQFPMQHKDYANTNYLEDVYFPTDPDSGADARDAQNRGLERPSDAKIWETVHRSDPNLRYISSTYAERNGGLVAPGPDVSNRPKKSPQKVIAKRHIGKTWDNQQLTFERPATMRLQGSMGVHRKRKGIGANPMQAW